MDPTPREIWSTSNITINLNGSHPQKNIGGRYGEESKPQRSIKLVPPQQQEQQQQQQDQHQQQQEQLSQF